VKASEIKAILSDLIDQEIANGSVLNKEEVVINKATISLPYNVGTDYDKLNKYPLILNPTVRLVSDDGKYYSYAGLTDSSIESENQGNINRSLCTYSPDVSHHVQEILNLLPNLMAALEYNQIYPKIQNIILSFNYKLEVIGIQAANSTDKIQLSKDTILPLLNGIELKKGLTGLLESLSKITKGTTDDAPPKNDDGTDNLTGYLTTTDKNEKGEVLFETSFKPIRKRLHSSNDCIELMSNSEIPQSKSIKSVIYANLGLLFYIKEIEALWQIFGKDHNLLLSFLSSDTVYANLIAMYTYPGVLSFYADFARVKSPQELKNLLINMGDKAYSYGVCYASLSKRHKLNAQKNWTSMKSIFDVSSA
jgi:hypothetical protein